MIKLTKAEEEVMQYLWELENAFVKDILEKFPEPKPAYNTISTIIRILEKKEFVAYKTFGRTHQYFPIIDKEEYKSFLSENLLSKYFGGSIENLVSFFAAKEEMNVNQLNELLEHIQTKKEKDE